MAGWRWAVACLWVALLLSSTTHAGASGEDESSSGYHSSVANGTSSQAQDQSKQQTQQQAERVTTVFPFYNRHIGIPHWLQYLSLTVVIKSLCVASNLAMQASPYRDVKKLAAKGDTGNLDPSPFIAMTFNCGMWSFYAVFAWYETGNRGFLTLVYANIVGLGLGAAYTAVFQLNLKDPQMWLRMKTYYYFFGGVTALECFFVFFLPTTSSLYYTGFLAAILSMCVTSAPLFGVPHVLKTGRLDSLPLDMIIVSAVSTILWLMCGALLHDKWILTCNTYALFVNFGFLCLIARFHPATAGGIASVKAKAMGLSHSSAPGEVPHWESMHGDVEATETTPFCTGTPGPRYSSAGTGEMPDEMLPSDNFGF